MDQSSKKIVFISHESSISGAPILFYRLIRLLKEHGYINFSIIIRRGGPLDHKFKALGPVIILKSPDYQKGKGIFLKIFDYLSYRLRLKKAYRKVAAADIVINNTITNGALIKAFASAKTPVITYVHELKEVMLQFKENRITDLTLMHSAAYFSPGKAVTENLCGQFNILPQRIFPLNYYFDTPQIREELKIHVRNAWLEKYGINKDHFLVAGMGAGSFRKGTDLFVDIAQRVCSSIQDIHFVWVGDFVEEACRKTVINKIEDYRLENNFTITGFIENNATNLLPFDLMALSSREDPYPLVVVEAALIGLPTVCFENSGGITEFMGDNAGFTVRSVEEFAVKIMDLYHNRALIKATGENARQKAIKLHSNKPLIIEQVEAGMDAVLHQSNK